MGFWSNLLRRTTRPDSGSLAKTDQNKAFATKSIPAGSVAYVNQLQMDVGLTGDSYIAQGNLAWHGWSFVSKNAIGRVALSAAVRAYVDKEEAGAAAGLPKSYIRKARKAKRLNKQFGMEDLPSKHALVRLLQQPHESQSQSIFLYAALSQLQVYHSLFIWIRRGGLRGADGLGRPEELIVLSRAAVDDSEAETNGRYWFSRPSESALWDSIFGGSGMMGRIEIKKEDMIDIRLPHPVYMDKPSNPTKSTDQWHDTSNNLDKSRSGFLRDAINPRMIIEVNAGDERTPSEIQEIVEQMDKNLRAAYGGADDQKGYMFLANSKATHASRSATEMDYSEGFRQMRDAAMATDGTPNLAAGVIEGGSHANLVAGMGHFNTNVVQPWCDLVAENLQRRVASWWSPLIKIEIKAPTVKDEDREIRRLMHDDACGLATVDERRGERGLPPLGGSAGNKIVRTGVNPAQVVATTMTVLTSVSTGTLEPAAASELLVYMGFDKKAASVIVAGVNDAPEPPPPMFGNAPGQGEIGDQSEVDTQLEDEPRKPAEEEASGDEKFGVRHGFAARHA